MKIAIQNPFAGKFAAETELSKRIGFAANNLGWQFAEVFSPEEIRAFAPDFVLSLHYHFTKLTEYPTYQCLWNPPGFFEGTEHFIRSILTYDAYLVSSDAIARRLKHLLQNTPKTYFTAPFYTSCHHHPYQAPNLENPRLAYLGVNWDGFRFQELFTLLDRQPYMEVYGSEKGWSYLQQAYRTNLPCDGVSVLHTLNRAGVGLCLHKEEHRLSKTPSMRIFEIVASGAIAICGEHDFIREVFGDTVLYIDADLEPTDMVDRISEHMAWIQANPQRAKEMSAAAYRIFEEHYTLEKLLLDLVPYHQHFIREKGFVEPISTVEVQQALGSVEFIVPIEGQPIKTIELTLDSLAKQTYRHLTASLIVSEARHDVEKIIQTYAEKLKIRLIQSKKLPYRSTPIWCGLNHVNSAYFAVLEPGNQIHHNHVYSLVSLLDRFPTAGVAHSGFIRSLDLGEIQKFKGTAELTSLVCFKPLELEPLMRFEDTISSNSLIARSSLLDRAFLQDPELYALEQLGLLLFLAQKASFVFSYETTCEIYHGTYHEEDGTFGTPIAEDDRWEDDRLSLKHLFWRQAFPNGKSIQAVQAAQREKQDLIHQFQDEVRRSQAQLEAAQARITAMETSKFWKLRSLWFKVKRSLGLPIDE